MIDAVGIQAATESAGGPPWLQIVLAGISGVVSIVTVGFTIIAARRSGTAAAVAVEAREQITVVTDEVKAVNQAVNNVPPGHPPLLQRMTTLERRVDSSDRWKTDALVLIAEQLGVALPDRRDYDPEEGS